ncbi:MAG TPA: DNA gyrase subunit A [Myxococcota bacterium]|nr:DNA gyrase subunit A [Myxococcota bacterium]
MSDIARHLVQISIADEMRTSYLDYSMSVIIGRALPDVRDGLKPVHRRILYAMHGEGLTANKKYSKCAGVVGEVLKRLHPHGDGAVYDALVRMAQPWNLRYPLVDGQGNFGSPDGDRAAAYRYTECRMRKLAEDLLRDIDKETVDFAPNFDGADIEPEVLPAAFPNLLVNGSEGIAVGMATKIPPHNLGEIIDATVALIDDPDLEDEDILAIVPGPDFPTGGIIYGRVGIRDAYTTGRGRVVIRARTHIEEIKGSERDAIIVDELPFQVGADRVMEQIARLVREKRIDGISAIRDESDRHGRRIVIECKRDAYSDIVLNKLYKHTDLQTTFGTILLAIVQGQPRVLTLRQALCHYIGHRRDVVTRRCRYLLRRATERAHILEGYRIALDHIDEIIKLIRASQTTEEARVGLIATFGLSEIQARNILEMQLRRLTGLEREKIETEYAEVLSTIEHLEGLLASDELLMGVVKDELLTVRATYADTRRTEIVDALGEIDIYDLIAEEDQAITLTVAGYIKRTDLALYREQKRGGFGTRGIETKDADEVREIFIANTHAKLLVFTTHGQVFAVPVYEIPEGGRYARGKPIVNLVNLETDDRIAAVLTISEFSEDLDLLFCSLHGLVKRTRLSDYKNMRKTGLRAYDCADGDELFSVILTPRDREVFIATRQGQSIRFPGEDVRHMGRVTRGVRGITIKDDDEIATLITLRDDLPILTISEKGFGKRTELEKYRVQGRSGSGIINLKVTEKTGPVVGAVQVEPEDKLMLITDSGRVIKLPVANIRVTLRAAEGVTVMRVEDDERIVSIARIDEDVDEDEIDGEDSAGEE